jgi:hypothetical protein
MYECTSRLKIYAQLFEQYGTPTVQRIECAWEDHLPCTL